MNVLNRKMFANRDARRKLANMGGILASSPELMQTAQRFQTGGPAVVKTKTVIVGDPLGGVRYDLYSDGSAIMLSTGRRIDPSNASNVPLLQMLQTLPDVTNTSISQPEEETNIPKLDTTPILNEQEISTESRSMLPIKDNRQELQDMIDSRTELVPGTNIPGPSEQYVIDKTSPNYTARDPSEIPEFADQDVETFLTTENKEEQTTTTTKGKRGDIRKTKTVTDPKSIFEILGIGEGGTGTGVSATRRRSGQNKNKQKIIEEKEVVDADDADADLEKAKVKEPGQRSFTPGEDDTIAALEEIATGGGTSEQKVEKIRKEVFGPGVDSQTAIAQYQTKFNDILGEDRDLNEEKWHTLAMIGFAIAAGEDSNALTNIANGLLEGTKMAREDRATRQARKDKINMLALEQFFADKRLREEIKGRKDVAQIRADASTADDTWFDTAQGKNAIAAYRDIFGTQNVSMKEEDKMPAFIKRVGEDSATVFFTLMNIPREETQTDTRTLEDIPDKKVKKSEQNK